MQFNGVNNKNYQHSQGVSAFFAYVHGLEFRVLFILGILACALSMHL